MAAVAPPSVQDLMGQIKKLIHTNTTLKGFVHGAKATNEKLQLENEKINAEKVKLEARVAELEAENAKLKTSSGIQLTAEDEALWASLNSSSYAAAAADDFFVSAPVVSKAASASASAPVVSKAASAPVVSKAAPAPVASKAASAPVVEDSVAFKADKCCNNMLKFGSCSFENCEYAHSAEELSGNDPCKFGMNCAHLSKPNEKGIFCSRSHPVEVEKKRFAEAKARFEEKDKQRAAKFSEKASQKAVEKEAYLNKQIELGKRIKMCHYADEGCINESCVFAHSAEEQILCPNLAVFGFEKCTFDKCIYRHDMTTREKDLLEAKEAAKQAEIEAKRKADKAERDAKEAAYFEAQQAKLKAAKKPVGFAGLEVEDA